MSAASRQVTRRCPIGRPKPRYQRSPTDDNDPDEPCRAPAATSLRVPADTGPRAPLTRRGGGVPARPRPPDANRRQRAAEPLRRLPRGAVRAGQTGVRSVAAHEVPVVRRARRSRLRDPDDSPGQEPADRARDGTRARPALPSRAREPRRRPAGAPPRRGRAIRARRPAARARAGAQRAEAPARAARALRCVGGAEHRLRGPAPAHERARALGSALPGGGRGRRAGRARRCRGAGGGGRARAGAVALVPVVGERARRAARLRGTTRASRGRMGRGAVIRELRREDAAAVARLELAINPHQVLTPEVVWHTATRPIEREQRRSWVAEVEGQVAGFAWANFEWSVPTPGKGRFWIRVDPGSRGRGIGGDLYARVHEYLRRRGAWRLQTAVDVDEAGPRVLQRLGFQGGGGRPRFPPRGPPAPACPPPGPPAP